MSNNTPEDNYVLDVASETDTESDAAGDWAAAMAEQGVTDEAQAEAAGEQVFKPLDSDAPRASNTRELDTIMDIPVRLNVQLGRTRITIKQLLDLTEGSVVELDGLAGDPMDILINGHLIAQGEVVVIDDKYGIRITDIVTASERIHKLNR